MNRSNSNCIHTAEMGYLVITTAKGDHSSVLTPIPAHLINKSYVDKAKSFNDVKFCDSEIILFSLANKVLEAVTTRIQNSQVKRSPNVCCLHVYLLSQKK